MRHNCNYKLAALIISSAGLWAAALVALAAGPSPGQLPAQRDEPSARARWLMGTLCIARAFGKPGAVGPALDAALDRIEEVESALTTWRPEGELARLNADCAAGRASAVPVPVSPDLFRALELAAAWAARTGGTFDPTVGALADAWGLRTGGRDPSEAEIAAARAATGHARFALDPAQRAVRCEPGLQFDLGAIGKGFALDEAAAVLRAGGVSRALLDFGGQLLALDPPPGQEGWPIELPDSAGRLLLRAASVASSGNAERGRHVLDPATGEVVLREGTVSVQAASAAAADALSTALFVAGPGRAAHVAPAGTRYVFTHPTPSTPSTPQGPS